MKVTVTRTLAVNEMICNSNTCKDFDEKRPLEYPQQNPQARERGREK